MMVNSIKKTVIQLMLVGSSFLFSFNATAVINVGNFLEWSTPSQIAKVEKIYDKAMGEQVNWKLYSSGVDMNEALSKGEIDIAFSPGLPTFVNAVNQNKPITMVGIAVAYGSADDCIVRNALGINKKNAKNLEGMKIAVPFNTTADFGLRMTLRYLGVDVNKVELVDAEAADAAFQLLETEVAAACAFGQNSLSKMKRVGKPLLTADEKKSAGIESFDVVAASNRFIKKNPTALRSFLQVTAQVNSNFAKDKSKIDIIAKDAALTVEQATEQLAGFVFPTVREQLTEYFGNEGLLSTMVPLMGEMFATEEFPKKEDYTKFIDSSFLE